MNDAVRPASTACALSTATVDGTSPVLTYNEILDASSTPASSTHEVVVDQRSGAAPSSMYNSGTTAKLTLATAVTGGQQAPQSYTVQSTNSVQDTVGNDTAAFARGSVTNNTGVTIRNATGNPTITATATFGSLLTAQIDDTGGLTSVTYTYHQWIAVDSDGVSNEVNIEGETNSALCKLVEFEAAN